jgi:hypothetical protein
MLCSVAIALSVLPTTSTQHPTQQARMVWVVIRARNHKKLLLKIGEDIYIVLFYFIVRKELRKDRNQRISCPLYKKRSVPHR